MTCACASMEATWISVIATGGSVRENERTVGLGDVVVVLSSFPCGSYKGCRLSGCPGLSGVRLRVTWLTVC